MTENAILVINAGSSSIKAAVIRDGVDLARVSVEVTSDHAVALSHIMDVLEAQGHPLDSLQGVGHRVVHGGPKLSKSAVVTPDVHADIVACCALAPLHNPHALAAIDAIAARAPDLPQTASFDTAFHATIPDVATRFALPETQATDGLRRYGFHGISYAALVRALPLQTGKDLPRRVLALHLGNGASLCAIRDGKSCATTMGYTPNAGLTMGTRSGDIDPAAVLELVRRIGVDQVEHMLNHDAGLLGLSGISGDMRTLEGAGTDNARFAMDHFCHWVTRHAGSMIAAMGGCDAVVFTGGIGENSLPIRDKITDSLLWAGTIPTHVVPAEEEAFIAREALALIKGQNNAT